MESPKKPNRLINEKSPYLLQHAYNPVDWYPWGEEAFAVARAENKPIFLSIGYSTCHWCHVMERESFENDSIAAIMNELFVNIKVDREERPDVDKVYMTALQAMGENGGWPMSMFLTPELKPFYGGTYVPPEERYGRIGFPDLLRRISRVWKNERTKVTESASGITKHLHDSQASIAAKHALDASILATCFEQASRNYDPRFGGFGRRFDSSSGGPKFPRPVVLNFLLRYSERAGNPEALEMAEHTLRGMSKGGMYDHIGGGFHRYSVDGEWRVPHFEKMLYDQAQIVNALVDVYLITKNPAYEEIIRETLEYVLRDMTDKDGGFYSAEDADSPLSDATHEEGEGAFYVWTRKEIEETLGGDAKPFNFFFGVEDAGNALSDPQQEFIGRNILYQANTISETATFTGLPETEVRASLARSRVKLFQLRAKRPRPHLDDKIITAWNGLMISAFARAAQALDEQKYSRAAERAAECVITRLYDANNHSLLRRYRDGEARFDAQLDDYAFFAQGLVDLYETSFIAKHLVMAIHLTERQLALFWDPQNNGFYDTPGNDASILVRMKEQYDGAEPTGNAIAVMNLLRLAYMTDNQDWREMAEKTLEAFSSVLHQAPFTMPQMVAAYDFSIQKVQQVVIAGGHSDEETRKLIRLVHSRYLPNTVIMFANGAGDQEGLSRYAEFLLPLKMMEGKPTAYVCEDFVCALPTSSETEVIQLLEKK